MDNDHGYLYQLFYRSWESTEGGAFVIDLILAFVVVIIIRQLEKRNKIPAIWHTIKKHPLLEDDKSRLLAVTLLIFSLQVVFIAPHTLFVENRTKISNLEKQLNDKSPRLEAFIHRVATLQNGSQTNLILFLDVSVSNSGETPSFAEEYGLRIALSNNLSVTGEELNFSNEYKLNFIHAGQPWLVDMKRHQLIAEKTVDSIPCGQHFRGWMAYRICGISEDQLKPTNITISFIDINENRIIATNGFWRGKPMLLTNMDDLAMEIPGAETIFYPVTQEVQTNWLPPELPPGCTNVFVVFGSTVQTYPRLMAEIDPDSGTTFAINDLPDFFLKDLDKSQHYSPRDKYTRIWERQSVAIGGKTFSYPIQPVIVSNRLYIEVQIPFSNEKHKIIMSDAFDRELPIPLRWDRNYSTNYGANGGFYYYEVVNELTNPVLQVAYYTPNTVAVNGIFQVDANDIYAAFGQRPQLFTFVARPSSLNATQTITTISLNATNFSEVLAISTNEPPNLMGEIITNELYRPIFQFQRRMFKYPSNQHLGEFEDWDYTNKSDTNIFGIAK